MHEPGGCCPHAFEPAEPPGYRCAACGLVLHAALVGWYERGVADGRADAWAHPPRPRAPRWLVASALALGVAFVGASPPESLPPPPPHEALDALANCLAAADALEADLESAWSRTAGADVVDQSRARVRATLRVASTARSDLAYALADARPCSVSRVPGCQNHAAPVLSARREAVATTSKSFRDQVTNARLSKNR